jgi:hypothetical protein
MISPVIDPVWEGEMVKAKSEPKVKVTLHLPERLTKDAKIYAIEHDQDLQDIVAEALRGYLGTRR